MVTERVSMPKAVVVVKLMWCVDVRACDGVDVGAFRHEDKAEDLYLESDLVKLKIYYLIRDVTCLFDLTEIGFLPKMDLDLMVEVVWKRLMDLHLSLVAVMVLQTLGREMMSVTVVWVEGVQGLIGNWLHSNFWVKTD